MSYVQKPFAEHSPAELIELIGRPVHFNLTAVHGENTLQTAGTVVNFGSTSEPASVLFSLEDGEKTTEVRWDPDQYDNVLTWRRP